MSSIFSIYFNCVKKEKRKILFRSVSNKHGPLNKILLIIARTLAQINFSQIHPYVYSSHISVYFKYGL